ncbi:MAG: glycosyltransferase family 39 protein [Candidatus Giovannonibacteria bacterium]|nr:glycosyltransferase family 39 protein [Candidatus Giovannonibacteria bacterium]
MQIYQRYKVEIWIFLLAFGLRFLYAIFVLLFFGEHGFISHSDTVYFYLRGAENLLNHHIFSLNTNPPYMPNTYHTPLYTFFVALFLWLKLPLFSIIFVQNLMAGAISVLIYRIGIILFSSERIGFWAAVLTALEPASIYWNNLLMSDYLFTFLFVLACYYFFIKRYYTFALCLGLATLTRPTSLYFLPLFMLLMIFEEFKIQKSWPHLPWRWMVITILIFLAVLFPWALRNKIVFDTWNLSSAEWYNLYSILTQQFADAEGFELPKPQLPQNYPNPETFHHDPANIPFYKNHFWQIVKERPFEYAKFHTTLALKSRLVNYYDYLVEYVLKAKFPNLFSSFIGEFIYFLTALGWFFWMAIYVLMSASLFYAKQRACLIMFLAMVAMIMFSAGATGAFGVDGSRFIMPLAPFMFLFAGAGFGFIYNRLKYVF